MTMSLFEAIASRLPSWQMDPVTFTEEALGRRLWSMQKEIARGSRAHKRTATRSGHKTGKSNGAANIAVDHCALATRGGPPLCLITAPTTRQVEEVIWQEVHAIFRSSKIPLGGRLYDTPQKGWRGPDGTRLIGFATDDPDNYSGFSSPNSRIIVDEAPGVPKKVMEAILGSCAGGAWLNMYGNPTENSGEFYDAFHSKRHIYKGWHVPSTSVPNVTGLEPAIPGLATPDWIAEMALLGIDNPIYQVRVLGNFAEEGTNVIIGIALVDKAREAAKTAQPKGRLSIGVDCARYGDDSNAIQPRRGFFLYPQDVFSGQNTIGIANRVLANARALRTFGEKPRIMVDEIGVGAGVFDQLQSVAERESIEVIAVNVAKHADDESAYANLRAQLWFGTRDWLRAGGMLDDPKLEAELIAPHFKYDSRGRYQVESKDEIKERLGRSPDRADALCLATYEGGFTPHGMRIAGL